jgi:hypothetical protein
MRPITMGFWASRSVGVSWAEAGGLVAAGDRARLLIAPRNRE